MRTSPHSRGILLCRAAQTAVSPVTRHALARHTRAAPQSASPSQTNHLHGLIQASESQPLWPAPVSEGHFGRRTPPPVWNLSPSARAPLRSHRELRRCPERLAQFPQADRQCETGQAPPTRTHSNQTTSYKHVLFGQSLDTPRSATPPMLAKVAQPLPNC